MKKKCTESCKRKFRKIGLSASKESLDTVFCHIFLAIHFYKNSSSTARRKPHTFKEKYFCNFPLLLLLHNYTKKITRMGPPPTTNSQSVLMWPWPWPCPWWSSTTHRYENQHLLINQPKSCSAYCEAQSDLLYMHYLDTNIVLLKSLFYC